MDRALLEFHMRKHGDNQGTLARALGLSQSSISERFNGRTEFRKDEIGAISKRYNLNADDIMAIFFAA